MIIGYSLAIVIGLSLGLLGGGGSILAVPVLVYVMKLEPKQAIALSLVIVGSAALFGVYNHNRKGNVDFKKAFTFASSAMIGAFLGAKLSSFISPTVQMLLFSVIMFVASFFMFRGRIRPENSQEVSLVVLLIQAFFVGILTGVIGVGGGFLIVPVLTLMAGLDMHKSIGTSLMIISLNCLAGFLGYVDSITIPWKLLSIFTALALVGIVIGSAFASKVPQDKLKKVFAIFLILMSFFIFYKNAQKLDFSYNHLKKASYFKLATNY